MPKREAFDVENFFDDFLINLETKFSQDTVYTDILDWLDNGGVDLERFGIELTPQQRLILAVTYGCELTEEQVSILEYWKSEDRTTYDFDFDRRPRTNLVLEAGRRSGKSLLGSLIINYEFEKLCRMESPQRHYGISSSTLISIICVAPSAEQVSKTIYGQARAMMYNVPFLRRLIDSGKIDPLEKMIKYEEKLLYIYSGNSKSETQVGGSPILIVLDEGALFEDANGESNALTLWDNLGAGGLPFREDAKRVIISSAWVEDDALVKLYKDAQESQNWIGFRLKSWMVNPKHADRNNPVIESMYISNRKMAELLFEGIRRPVQNAFLEPEEVKRAFKLMSNLYASELPIEGGLIRLRVNQLDEFRGHTVMHLDPAISRDAYALAYAHCAPMDGRNCVFIDGMMAWVPRDGAKVSISNVQQAIYNIHNVRPLSLVSADQKESQETLQRLKAAGIPTETLHFTNAKQVIMYDCLRKLLHEDRLFLPKNSPWTQLLKTELLKLELIKGMKIDHPPGGCFTADTRIPLLDGTRPTISELEGKEVWVYSCMPDGTIVPGKARGRKTKEVVDLVDVVLDNGAVVRCTPEHPFMTRAGGYIKAIDIVPGVTRLMPISFRWPTNGGYEKIYGAYPKVLTHHMALGYPDLGDDKVVHHINHNKTDNRPENLEVVDRREHTRHHTTRMHGTDPSYRQKLSEGTIAFNRKDSTRLKRSQFMRSLTSQFYVDRARKHPKFRKDMDGASLYTALKAGCSNAHQAATYLGCSRNLVIRILKDEGYSSWEVFEQENFSLKFTLTDATSVRDGLKLYVSIEEVLQAYKGKLSCLYDLCTDLSCTKDAVLRCLTAQGYKGWEDFKRKGIGSNHKVRAVIPVILEAPVSVYDLEVDEWHNFALCAGVFVHNSKDLADCVAVLCWRLIGKEMMHHDAAPRSYRLNEFTAAEENVIPTRRGRSPEDAIEVSRSSLRRELRATKRSWKSIGFKDPDSPGFRLSRDEDFTDSLF